MRIIHHQKIMCVCAICKKEVLLDETKLIDGQEFLKVNKLGLVHAGWLVIWTYHGEACVCPDHKVVSEIMGLVRNEIRPD